jgi:hypothetical protein
MEEYPFLMQRLEKLEDCHNALCDALQDVNTGGVINSKRIGELLQGARLKGDDNSFDTRMSGGGLTRTWLLSDDKMLTLKDDNNDTREVKRTSLHMKGAKDEQRTEGTDVVDDSRVRDRATYSSTVDEVMAQVDETLRNSKAFGNPSRGLVYDLLRPIISKLVAECDALKEDVKTQGTVWLEMQKRAERAEAEASKWETTAMCEKSRREKAEAELVDVKLERCVLRDATVDEVASALEEYGHYSVALVVRKMKEGQG